MRHSEIVRGTFTERERERFTRNKDLLELPTYSVAHILVPARLLGSAIQE